eukprot:7653209-Lingulodinium_polyedra.AAC.1
MPTLWRLGCPGGSNAYARTKGKLRASAVGVELPRRLHHMRSNKERVARQRCGCWGSSLV